MTKHSPEPRKHVNFKLDGPTRKSLEILAKKLGISQAQVIERAVEELHVKTFEPIFADLIENHDIHVG